jgi:voltage-gated potassium channel
MNPIAFLVLRRMRAPLLLLSFVYAIATLGLTTIPGVDDQGNVWHMDFFHALYFVSFMGTTIGFGEIPYPFTDAQRMWTLIFVFITVATWIYAIGTLISLLQNEALKKALLEYQFSQQVRLLTEPFYLVCGYGDTGSKLVDSLVRNLDSATVIDIKQDRLDALTLKDFPLYVPGICADASNPEYMQLAGVNHPMCKGVVAITNDNAANLHIAITAKVLNPDLKVVCRADSHDVEANLASFGTDHIIDPFDTFASLLGLAIHSPHQYLLDRWFHDDSREELAELIKVPRGRWILCGFGRFGQALYREFVSHGLEVQVIEPNALIPGQPEGTLCGLGTEAVTLNEADIQNVAGIVAGADDDSNNLSIVVTALELNPNLFVIARQNEHSNKDLFSTSLADLVMAPSDVLVNKIRTLLTNRLVDDFLSLARAHDDLWARSLADQLRQISDHRMPEVWAVTICDEEAHAVIEKLAAGEIVLLRHLLADHTDRTYMFAALPLLFSNSLGAFCMPDLDTPCHLGDRILFAGTTANESRMKWNLQNEVALTYVMTGRTYPQSTIGKWFAARISKDAA